jgi:thiamine pyrophosphokinase
VSCTTFSKQRKNGKERYMKAFIYTGGNIDVANIVEFPQEGDLVIAADSGYKNAVNLGAIPTVILGDFDSLPQEELESVTDNAEILTVPAEKDFTDTQLAVDTAIKRGATEITVIGGLSGRLDHTLSNLAILRSSHLSGVRTVMTDGINRVRYIKNDSIIILKSKYKYLSLIAISEKVKGVTVEGCKYPLDNATLTNTYQYAVSNEIQGNCAFIAAKKGELLIIESRDRH